MYRCDKCKKVSEPGQARFTFVQKTREKKRPLIKTNESNTRFERGTEIVEELHVCERCYDELTEN